MYASIKMNRLLLSSATVIAVLLMSIFISSGMIADTVSNQDKDITLPVLMYHGIRNDTSAQNKYVISPDEFEADLKYLKENGYETIVVADLLNYFENGNPLPNKPIILTFDDGCLNNYTYAYPLLKKYNAKIILSPIGRYVDEYTESGDKNPAYAQADWNTLRKMSESGLVELQNHTYDMHASSGRIGASQKSGESDEDYKTALTADLTKFNKRMKEELNITPTAFVYPYGAVSKTSPDIVKELGFKASFDCANKINIIKNEDDLYGLHRFIRPHGKGIKEILYDIK